MIVASTEDELQSAVYALNTDIKHNLKISVDATKAMALKGKMNVRTKTALNNSITERVNVFIS